MMQTKLWQIKHTCPKCSYTFGEQEERKYCKTLDKRLIVLLDEIRNHLKANKEFSFNPRHIWRTDIDAHHKIADFQKLGYWKIISKRPKHSGWWYITDKGKQFMKGEIQVPRRIWVKNKQVVEEDDELVSIIKLDPRWQISRSDYAMDFITSVHPSTAHESP